MPRRYDAMTKGGKKMGAIDYCQGGKMEIRRVLEFDHMHIEQMTAANDDRGEWWGLFLMDDDEEWIKTAIDRSLRGLLDGDHMRCFERFHATGEEREVIEEWRRQAGEPID